MLETFYADRTESEVGATFGGVFAEAAVLIPVGEWQGPVSSSGRVVSDMEFEAKASARDQLYQEIAQNYEVLLDGQVREFLDSAE
jgi:hypothetical protein